MTDNKQLYFDQNLLEKDQALSRFIKVRELSERLSASLSPEDTTVQSMLETSPTKWHLAHTSWYFENFILREFLPSYQPFNPDFHFLFNSYYQGAGPQFERAKRGLLSHPTLAEVLDYRDYVTKAMLALIDRDTPHGNWSSIVPLLDLGCHHEEQHQELLLTDIKHAFSINPMRPSYRRRQTPGRGRVSAIDWLKFDEGQYEIGHDGNGFAFDCEGPRHKIYLYEFELASRPVTNREFLQFVKDDVYKNPEYWMAEAWDLIQAEGWDKPLYWQRETGHNEVYTLFGVEPLNPNEPVCHISYYEADAYARWAQKIWPGSRLPTEAELEVAAARYAKTEGTNDLANDRLHPRTAGDTKPFAQLFGDVWEWTSSAFSPYPNYSPPTGVVGEYNGKFMANQMVLKGGSCVTPNNHIRPSYRNFFYPQARWQYTGVRLARNTGISENVSTPVSNVTPTPAPTPRSDAPVVEAPATNQQEPAAEKAAVTPEKTVADTGSAKGLSSILDDDILGDDILGDDFLGDVSDFETEENSIDDLIADTDSNRRKAHFIDLKPTVETFRDSVIAGLKSGPKVLYAKHFYDEKGSELFNQICKLDEYYPTETEKGILRRRIRTIAQQLAEKVQLVEFGSGSSDKVRILIRALEHFDSYVPIDISREILMQSSDQLATEFPHIEVTAICADYTKRVDLPPPSLDRPGGRMGFFPGSTIGNFSPENATGFLKRAGEILGSGAGLIIGVDLKKDKDILELAYNDKSGVTAKFNLNILARINSELDGNFKLGNFEHLAFYNDEMSRIEMHLVSLKNQKVNVSGEEFSFEEGETIHTESSFKYSVQEFKQMVIDAGLKHAAVWEDKDKLFSVHYIKIP